MTTDPAVRRSPGGEARWVVLCYHDVLPETSASGGGPARFDMPLSAFERGLDAMAAAGYAGVSVADALARPGTARVAITFDDGTRGQFEHAAPALRARGMTATFYVVSEWVGRPGHMTWDELRLLKTWGMSVQSHSRSHPFLSELDEQALRRELVESLERIDAELSQVTRELAFPGGDPPARPLRRLIGETGYEISLGTRWGIERDGDAGRDPGRWLRRCTMRGDVANDWLLRVIAGDARLALGHGVRESVLRNTRSLLGPTRYARWRRGLLNALARGQSA